MSAYVAPVIKTFIAGADLSAKQFHAVKIGSADDQVIICGANEKSIGILMNAPASGERAEVAVAGGCKVKLAETLSALALVTPTSTGTLEQVDLADEWCSAVLVEGGASGDVVSALVQHMYSSKSDA